MLVDISFMFYIFDPICTVVHTWIDENRLHLSKQTFVIYAEDRIQYDVFDSFNLFIAFS